MQAATVQKMSYLKAKGRPDLSFSSWSEDGYYKRQKDVLKTDDTSMFTDTFERISINDFSNVEFSERYETGSKPCLITGVTETWTGKQEWQPKVSIL